MFKKVAGVNVFALAVLVGAASQSTPKFDAVSIKPGDQNARNVRFIALSHGRYDVEDQPTLDLILFAFDLDATRLRDVPAWVKTERYTIDATASGGGDRAQMRPMVQALLVDRFHLAAHRETRRMADYEMLIAPGGSKFPPAPAPGQPWPKVGPVDPKNPDRFVEPTGNEHSAGILGMASLPGFLASELGRPVIDKSGISGRYEIRLLWQPGLEEGAAGQPAGPSLFTAVREQLGLRLKAAHDPIDVLVIDRIARPTAN